MTFVKSFRCIALARELFIIFRFITFAWTIYVIAFFHVTAHYCVDVFFMSVVFVLDQFLKFMKHNDQV